MQCRAEFTFFVQRFPQFFIDAAFDEHVDDVAVVSLAHSVHARFALQPLSAAPTAFNENHLVIVRRVEPRAHRSHGAYQALALSRRVCDHSLAAMRR